MSRKALDFLLDGFGADAAPVVRAREHGGWSPSAPGFGDEVRGLGAALLTYGLGEGVRAAVLGSEGTGTLRAGLAVIAAGGTLVPLDPALSQDALRRALISSDAVFAIASDEAQLSRVLKLRPELPALELVLLMSAAPSERKSAAMLVAAAIEVGLGTLASDPALLRRAAIDSGSGPACLLANRAGETRPVARTVLLDFAQSFGQTLAFRRGKTVLTALPVGGLERLAASLAALSQGATLLLPDAAERLDAGLDQYPPDVVLLDATGLERLFRSWVEDIDAKSWLGRAVTRWAVRTGRGAPNASWKRSIAESLSLRGLRGKLGGQAATLDVIASVDRPPAETEATTFFTSIGLPLRYVTPDSANALAQ